MATQFDNNGTPYHSNSTGPAVSGQQVTMHTPNGPQQATMVSGLLVPNNN